MQLDLFPDLKVTRARASKEYGAFTDKFKTKLTTDDCYTPEPVYNAVRDWCVKKYGLQGREIVRPFWPGADFEMYDYPENCVVIDNPPFSIYAHVLDFYTNERPTDFFLFAPSLTLFKKYDACYVMCSEDVEYANGAIVKTSFVTSLDKENRVICDQTLKHAIRTANAYGKPKKAELPIIEMPKNVITSAILNKTTSVEFALKKKDCAFINKINGYKIFGGGFILSDRAAADREAADREAADRAAADRAAADREAARKKIVKTFGKEELELLNQLNQKR